jgi:hypothetical protein
LGRTRTAGRRARSARWLNAKEPPLAQSLGTTRMVPIREPSLLGHPGRQLRFQLLESGLKPRRLPPPLLLPQGQGLPQKPGQLRPPLLLPLKPPQLPQEMSETLLLPPMVLSPETVRYPHAREPRPQDLHHLRGPAPIDGGPLKTHNPDPYPPDPLPRLIGVHRHRQIPGHPKQLCHLPRDAPADASGLPPAPSPSAAPVADDTGRGWRDRTRFGKCHRTPTPTGRIGSSPTQLVWPAVPTRSFFPVPPVP